MNFSGCWHCHSSIPKAEKNMTVFPGSNWILILSEGLHAGPRLYGSLYHVQSYGIWKYRLTEDKKKSKAYLVELIQLQIVTQCIIILGLFHRHLQHYIFQTVQNWSVSSTHPPTALQSSSSLLWLSFGVLFVLIPEQEKSFVPCFPLPKFCSPNDICADLVWVN